MWQLTPWVNDMSSRDEVYTRHLAHICEYLCVCGHASVREGARVCDVRLVG